MNVCFRCNPVSLMQEDENGFYCPIHGSALPDSRDNGGEYSKWCTACSRPEAFCRHFRPGPFAPAAAGLSIRLCGSCGRPFASILRRYARPSRGGAGAT